MAVMLFAVDVITYLQLHNSNCKSTNQTNWSNKSVIPSYSYLLLAWLKRGTKSDALLSLVRVEYGQTLLGESGKIETTKDTRIAEYNFSTSFECTFDEPYCFDGICQKPVVGMKQFVDCLWLAINLHFTYSIEALANLSCLAANK